MQRTATMTHDPWVLWPAGAPPAGGWPMLLFLHGQGEAAWLDEAGREREHGPDALLAHGSPVALHQARDPRVPTLWQSFVLVAPQAFNDVGRVPYWRWTEPGISKRVAAEVERVLATGKVNAQRISAAGFSRGGMGCFQLDANSGPLQFRKIATADAQSLDDLPAAVQRGREVRAYYGTTTYQGMRDQHRAAEKLHGRATPPVSIIALEQSGNEDQAHIGLCPRVFAQDELYRWLLA